MFNHYRLVKIGSTDNLIKDRESGEACLGEEFRVIES
jgi:hypothetical protein